MINFYHRFLPTIAKTLIPLHKAVGQSKGKTIEWNEECEVAFEESKSASGPSLRAKDIITCSR